MLDKWGGVFYAGGSEELEGATMTESEWLASRNFSTLFICTVTIASDRGERNRWLLACACCRSVWHLLPGVCHQIVELVEGYADGTIEAGALVTLLHGFWPHTVAIAALPGGTQAAEAVGYLGWSWRFEFDNTITSKTYWQANQTCRSAAEALAKSRPWDVARHCQIELLRDIFGNPFRPAVLDPAWLTLTVTSLAQAAYEERMLPSGELDRIRLTILADALEEAGCDNTDILNHLRGPGPHVRGCWPVDLLLGKS